MSPKRMKFLNLILALLLAIGIMGSVLPVHGQTSGGFQTGSRKTAIGGAATIDPVTLPNFEFKYLLDFYPIANANYRVAEIEDTKFDSRLFLQRMVISGAYATKLSKIELRETGGSYVNQPFSIAGGVISIGSASNAIDSAAAANVAAQTVTYNNTGSVPDSHVNNSKYDRIRFTFRNESGGTGAIFNQGTNGSIGLYFRVLKPYSSQLLNGSGTKVYCDASNPNTPVDPKLVCNYATFKGYYGSTSASVNTATNGIFLVPTPTYQFRSGTGTTKIKTNVNDTGSASFSFLTTKMMSTNPYSGMTFVAILPAGYEYASSRVTNNNVQAQLQSVNVTNISGGRKKVVLKYNDFTHATVGNTQAQQFNFVVNYVPTESAPTTEQTITGYLYMTQYNEIQKTGPGMFNLRKNGSTIATSIGTIDQDTDDADADGNTTEYIFKDTVLVQAVAPTNELKGATYFDASGYSRLKNVARGNTYTYRTGLTAYGAPVSRGVVYEAFPDPATGSHSRLNGQISNPAPARYRIEYCTTPNMPANAVAGAADGACTSGWQTTLPDYSQATAYRIKVQNGQAIPLNTTDVFTVTMTANGRGYDTSEHNVWYSQDDGLTFKKSTGSPLVVASMLRVKITSRWTKPAQTIPNPDTTATITGTPNDLVVSSELGSVPLTGSSLPNTESSITETKDLSVYGVRSNLNIPLAYDITASAVPNWTGPATSGTCTINNSASQNAIDQSYDYHCYFDYNYPSPTSVVLTGTKNWDANITLGRSGAFDLSLQYRISGSGADWANVPPAMLLPSAGSVTNCVQSNPVEPTGTLNSEQYVWCVPKGPSAAGTDEYEFRLYEQAKSPDALVKWKASDGTPVLNGGSVVGFASNAITITNGAGSGALSNVLNKKNYGDDDDPSTPGTNEDAIKVKVSWYNGPTAKPEAYVTLLRMPLSGGESCSVGATPETVVVNSQPVRFKISDLTESGWTTTNISGDVVSEKTYELTGMPKMNDFGCTYTYFVAETNAGGADLTPAGYNKTITGSGKNHSVVNRYNVPHVVVKGTKKWVDGDLLVRPAISMGLYIKETIGGVDYLLSPEHPNLTSRVPQPIYLSDCGIAGDPNTYEAAGIVAVADGTTSNYEDTVFWCVPEFYKDGVTPITYYVDEGLGNEFSNASPNAGAPAGPSGLNTGKAAPANYVKTYTNGNLEITNTYVPPTVNPDVNGVGSIEAAVVWLPTGVTPGGDITLTLMRTLNEATDCTAMPTPSDCSGVASATLTVANAGVHNWKHKWIDTPNVSTDDLPATDIYGARYYYKVVGSDAPANFIKEASTGTNAALTATYRYQQPRTEVAGKKIWDGGPALKPNVRLTLQRSSDNGATWEDVPNNEVFLDATHTEPEYARRAAVTLNGGTTPTTDVKWYTTKNSPGGVEYIFSIRENALTNYTGLNVDAGNNPVPHSMQIRNVYQSPLGLVTLTKVWAGGPAIRPAATVTIQRSTDGATWEEVPNTELNNPGGESLTAAVTLAGGAAPETTAKWFTTLFDPDGARYQFTVVEGNLDEYPNPTITGTSGVNREITVVNTFRAKKIDIEGTKLWIGGSEIAKPASIRLTLQRQVGANFVSVDPTELTAPDATYTTDNPATVTPDGSGDWKVKWNVDEKDGAGVAYTYKVVEAPADVPSGWVIDNTTPGATTDRQVTNRVDVVSNQTVTGEKKWIGGSRADITLVLYRILLNADGTDRPGTKLQVPPNDDPQTITIEAIPNPVTLALAAEGGHGWKYTWTGLPDRDTATGLKYRYFVDEQAVPAGYRKVESQSDPTPITDNETLTVTNELIPVAGTVTGVKIWQGGRDRNRENVVLQLWRTPSGGGAPELVPSSPSLTNPVTLNHDNATGNPAHNWQYTWTGLNTTDYAYEVREDTSGLTQYTEVADANPNSVTNKYNVPLFDDPATPGNENGKIIGRVVWLNGGAAIDTATVQLQIYAKKTVMGNPVYVPIGAPVTLNGADAATHHWQHEWTNLPAEDEATGEAYEEYIVDDVAAPAGFEQVDEHDASLSVITDNRDLQVTYRKPQTAGTFTGKKIWSGGSPVAGCDITLQLWQKKTDGTDDFMVTTDMNNAPLANNPATLTFAQAGTHHWEFTWTNLKELPATTPATIYYVREGTVPAVCPFIEDPSDSNPQTVTNVYQIATKQIQVTKTWVDGRTKREPVEIRLERLPVGGAWGPAPLESGGTCAAANPAPVTPPGGVNNPSAPAGNQSETITFCTKAADANGPYQFRVVEIEPGSNLHNDRWDGVVTGDADAGFVVTNTFTPEMESLTITKIWMNNIVAANPVTITLQQATGMNPPDPSADQLIDLTDAEFVGASPTRWAKTVTKPKTDQQGVEYTYTVTEAPIPLCTTTYPVPLTVQNDCTSANRDLKLVIDWVGGPTPYPAVTVHVKGHVGSTDTDVILNGAGLFEHTMTLPANHTNGDLINYTVTVNMGQPGLADYDVEFTPAPPTVQLTTDQEVHIKLTYRAPLNSVTANKVWVGGSTLTRPTIWFTLYQKVQGSIDIPVPVPGAPIMVLNHGTTSVTWPNIAQVDSSARPLEFSVLETDASGDATFVPASYTKAESGLTVTNTYQSAGTVSANKVWQSGSGPHPTIWFKLYRQLGSNPVEEVPVAQAPIFELTAGNLQADWHNVELTDADGRPYKFSVKEVDATGADWTPDGYIKIERDLTVVNTKRGLLTIAVNTDPATSTAFEINVANANGDSVSARIDNDSSDPTYPDQMVVTDIPTVAHTVKINNLDPNVWEVTAIECTQKPLGSTNPADEVPLPITPVRDFNGKLTGEFTIDTVQAEHALSCVYDLRSLIGGRIIVNNETLPNPAQPIFPTYEYRTDGAGYNDFTLAANSVIPDTQEVQPGTYKIAQANINGWVTMDVIVTSSIPGRTPFVSLVDQRITGTVPPNGTGWESIVTFTLEPKETVTVKFVNAPSNTVMIRKETIPSGKPQKFEFRGRISGFIGDGEYLIESGLTPDGTQWQITEQGYEEWKLTEVRCVERGVIGDTPTRGDHGLASAFIGLDDGESILCTFINRHETEPEEHYDPPVPGFTDFDTLPRTGFAPGRITKLPEQPAAKLYQTSPMILKVPGLNQSLEVYGIPVTDGEWDVTWLGQHAGYLEGSAYPLYDGNTILTAHVWDAYNNPGPFFGLKDLKYGDRFTIEAFGKTYTYEIRESDQILESDVAQMMVRKEGNWITLMTCEAYDEGEDKYTYRRMVRGVLIDIQ